MSVPTFSRIEIRHGNAGDLAAVSDQLVSLAHSLRQIGASVKDETLMRLAAHDAIRQTSQKLRGTGK